MLRNCSMLVLVTVCAIAGVAPAADAQQSPAGSVQGLSSRRTSAVTYEARRTTKVDLVGTPLMPRTRGEAEIKTESAGPVWIKAKMRGLTSASQFGPEYLTFVLWAIRRKDGRRISAKCVSMTVRTKSRRPLMCRRSR